MDQENCSTLLDYLQRRTGKSNPLHPLSIEGTIEPQLKAMVEELGVTVEEKNER
jgi:hypothetical protein